MSVNKIKKAVIREDLLAITENYQQAIILNQFIYWSERVADADEFIKSENEIAKNNGECERELFYGWIYKTAEELSQEVMLGLSASQTRKYINKLVELGFIAKRNNPKYKWDRTLQYRVNLVNIAKALKSKGYPLSDYRIEIPDDDLSIAHTGAINEAQKENQTISDDGAIPEITNRDYNNIDYNSENTPKASNKLDVYTQASNPKGLDGGLQAQKPEVSMPAHLQNEKPIQKNNSSEQDIKDMVVKVGEICDKELWIEAKEAEPIINTIAYFFVQHYNHFGKWHPRLRDKTLQRACEIISDGPKDEYRRFSDYEITEKDWQMMVDEYFRREYGTVGGEPVNKSLMHFLQKDILKNLAYAVFKDWF